MGSFLEDTGTNLKTLGTLFGAQLTSSLVENFVFSMGGKAYKDSLQALAALPESAPEDQVVLRPIVAGLGVGILLRFSEQLQILRLLMTILRQKRFMSRTD